MKKEKEGSLLLGVVALLAVIIIVALVGILALEPEKIQVQGEAEAAEYRVSGKVPGRVEMYLFEEGEQVRKGDTLVIIYSPEVEAKKDQALAARRMAEAVNDKAKNGAQPEQIEGAYELYQKALAGEEIYRKSYERVQRLFEKGVVLRDVSNHGSGEFAERLVELAFRPLGDVSTQDRTYFEDGRYTKTDLYVRNLKAPVIFGRGDRAFAGVS